MQYRNRSRSQNAAKDLENYHQRRAMLPVAIDQTRQESSFKQIIAERKEENYDTDVERAKKGSGLIQGGVLAPGVGNKLF